MRGIRQGLSRAYVGVSGLALANTAMATVLGVLTARFLLPEGHGRLTVATTAAAVVALALAAGSGLSLRLRARHGEPTTADLRAFSGLTLALTPLAGGATSLVVFIGSARPSTAELAASFALGAVSMMGRQLAELLQAFGRVGTAIASVGVGVIGQIVLIALLALSHSLNVETAVVAAAFGAVMQSVFCLLRTPPGSQIFRPQFAIPRWVSLMKQGSPSLGHTLGLVGLQRVDRVLVVALVSPTAGGLYAVASTVAETARVPMTAIGQVLFVRVSVARHVPQEVRRTYRVALAMQVVVLTSIALASPTLVPLVFGAAYEPAVPVLQGLLVAEAAMSAVMLDARIVMGLDALRALGGLTLALAAATLIPLPLVISAYGLAGAVAASIVSYSVLAMCTYVLRRGRTSVRGRPFGGRTTQGRRHLEDKK